MRAGLYDEFGTIRDVVRTGIRPRFRLDLPLGNSNREVTMGRYQGLIGIVVLLGIAVLLSNNRRKISPRIVVGGLGLQFGFAFLILRTDAGRQFFEGCKLAITHLLDFSQRGTDLLFESHITNEVEPAVINLACRTLPTVIFFSALLALLYHLGIMQLIVKAIAWVMVRTMGTSGAETLSIAGNIFVGQTESPLLIRPYIAGMTRSELLTVMCGGFATIAGGVMAIYVSFLEVSLPDIAGHLMAASVMSAPAALVVAKVLYPETEETATRGTVPVDVERSTRNALDAIGEGATQGMKLCLNIAAMLIAFVALIALANFLLGLAGFSMEQILGRVFQPLAWCMGAEWSEADTLGRLLGEKLVLTELIAYSNLGKMQIGTEISERTYIIASYALCGFANFASIGVQLGGIGGIAPERKADLAQLALKAMIGGALASWMTASIAGVLIL